MTTAADVIEEAIESHRFDKNGESLVEELLRLHLKQSPGAREEFLDVYREWLRSNDPGRAHWAIVLIQRLGLTSELNLLEEILQEIRHRRSKLPEYFEQFLVPAIADLKRGRPT